MSTIQQGSTGPDVLTWQTDVLKLDLPDGVFGPATKASTQAWQTQHNLPADGVVGPRTWNAAGYSGPIPVTHTDVYQTYVPQPGDYGYKAPASAGPETTGYGTRVAPAAPPPSAYVPKSVVAKAPVIAPTQASMTDAISNVPWWVKVLALLGVGYGVIKATEKRKP